MSEVERLLRSALVPIEPSEGLSDRLERRLSHLSDAAAGELADWEPSVMRDPRNWARPLAAAMVGTLAGGALIVVRARQHQKRRSGGRVRTLERSVRGIAEDLTSRLRR